MRLHRFHVSQKIGDESQVTIDSAELVNQVRRVFRLEEGDSIVLFNGTGFDYVYKIDSFEKSTKISSDSAMKLTVTETKPSRFLPTRKIYLCAAVVKKDTFEWIVEKATELGVTDIIPIAAERSEKKSLNEERLVKIATEASEQSGRGTTPMMHHIMGQGEATAFLKKENPDIELLAFHTEGELLKRGEFTDKKTALGVFIGPEGGWSPEEMEMFHKDNVAVRCLGPQVLRAETAVIASLAQVVFNI